MKKIVYIGGIGSSSRQADRVAQALSARFKQNVTGLSFSQAHKKSALLARWAPEALIITHAAGMTLLKDMSPKEVIAIAPPMPLGLPLAIWRSLVKTIALFKSSNESNERRRDIALFYLFAAAENLLRPHLNIAKLWATCDFDAARFAVELVTGGCKVTLGFMENDLLYPNAPTHHHIEVAKDYGVDVYDTILGHHDELVFYPLEVLAQLRNPDGERHAITSVAA